MRPVRRREGSQRPGRDERRRDEHYRVLSADGPGGDTRTRSIAARAWRGKRGHGGTK